jgi:hypothetical protein
MVGLGEIVPSGWQKVLERILEQPIEIEFLEIGSPQSDKIKKKIELTFKESSPDEIKTAFPLRTEELAEYKPIAERAASPKQISHYLLGSKITYNVNKITWYSDKVFQECCTSLGIEKPPEELVKLFRIAFSHVVRKHMLFHYKVERGSRLLPEDRYWEYRVKIYERSDAQTKGVLEEALADAYAVTYVEDEIRALQSPVSMPISKESLVAGFRKMIRAAFINDSRPPGYREAKNFLLEFENLRDANTIESIQSLLLYSAILKGVSNIDGVFRGLSWLYRELTFLEPTNLEKWPLPPAPPYPTKSFLLFVENFRSDASLFLLLLLPPTEEPFIDKEFYPKRLPVK